ncbi:MAG: helical backbone metal receptor [Planctomycetota bacterium]
MRTNLLIAVLVVAVFGAAWGLKRLTVRPAAPPPAAAAVVRRIISLAPSITETIYLLGLEGKLVGDTTYCVQPPAARAIAKVGGYATPDFEKIVMLKPDLVIMMTEHRKAGLDRKFDELGLPTLFVATRTTAGILDSIRQIGRSCGAADRAEALCRELAAGTEAVRARPAGRAPRVLITVGKNMGSAGLKTAFAAGKDTYYDELLTLAGGVNACPASVLEYVEMGGEAILLAAPDLVIDIVPDATPQEAAAVVATWRELPAFKARVAVLCGEYVARPGPSFVKLLGDIRGEIEAWNHSSP